MTKMRQGSRQLPPFFQGLLLALGLAVLASPGLAQVPYYPPGMAGGVPPLPPQPIIQPGVISPPPVPANIAPPPTPLAGPTPATVTTGPAGVAGGGGGGSSGLLFNRTGELWISASLYVLKPYFADSTGFVVQRGDGISASNLSYEFSYNYDLVPLVEAGIGIDAGLGIRARYFHYDQESPILDYTNRQPDPGAGGVASFSRVFQPAGLPDVRSDSRLFSSGPVFQSPGVLLTRGIGQDVLSFTSSLAIKNFDLEATHEFQTESIDLLFSLGGRYVQATQNYRGLLRNSGTLSNTTIDPVTLQPVTVSGTVNETSTVFFGQNFYGGGPTLATQARVYLFNTGIAAFANARGSLLVGQSKRTYTARQTIDDITGVLSSQPVSQINDSNSQTKDHLIPVAEMELGLEYAGRFGNGTWFCRAAVVDQTYFGLGGPATTEGNLSLFGAVMSLGIGY